MRRLRLLAALGAAAALATSHAADAPSRAASAAQWGSPAPRPGAPSSEARQGAQGEGAERATGDYFEDFAALMLRVRSVRWLEEICSDAFPADAALDQRAYDDWLRAHRAFVNEMEGQFALIDRRWSGASPDAAREGIGTSALQARLEANRVGLRDDFLARPLAVQRKRCDAYPTLLLSRALDLERSQADFVRSVRQGPPP